jgi:hypothetical protein
MNTSATPDLLPQQHKPDALSKAESLALRLMVELQEVHHTKPSGTSIISKQIMEFVEAVGTDFKVNIFRQENFNLYINGDFVLF